MQLKSPSLNKIVSWHTCGFCLGSQECCLCSQNSITYLEGGIHWLGVRDDFEACQNAERERERERENFPPKPPQMYEDRAC